MYYIRLLKCQNIYEIDFLRCKKCIFVEVEPAESEVIVDAMCGGAVLRGADVFTPGILSIHPPTNISTIVILS